MELPIGVSSEGTAPAWSVLLEDRVVLLEGVELTIEVLSERPARAWAVLLEAVGFGVFRTPADCFPSSYQHGRLSNGERSSGRGKIRFAGCCSVASVRLSDMLGG